MNAPGEDVFLDGWASEDLEAIIARCSELFEDTTFPTVRRWREAGGKVLGHFQVYFPEELAHAAGMLPVKVRGAKVDGRDADPHFGSYLCSIMKSSFQLALDNSLELDLFVSHPICDAARNLAAIWGRNVEYPSHILYLPQNPNSRHAPRYLCDEYRRMLGEIEAIAERSVSDADMRASLEVFNTNRRLIRQLHAMRRTEPWKLPMHEAFVLTAVGTLVPREEHNRLLESVLPKIEDRPIHAQDRLRVVYQGGFCELPPIDMLRAISESCYVVEDDLLIGVRWLTEDVSTAGDPVQNLATAYIETSEWSPVQHDLRKPKERMLLEAIEGSGARAAILTAAKMCEPGLEEQVTYARTLDDEAIPYFITEFEEGTTTFSHLEIQLETFVERLMFA